MIIDEKEFNEFIQNQIRAIAELFDWEYWLDDILRRKYTKNNLEFTLVERNWLEKWKEIIGYEKIKCKCIEYKEFNKDSTFKEIYDYLLNANAKQKLDNLGKMDISKLVIKDEENNNFRYKKFIESGDFIPIDRWYCKNLKCGNILLVKGSYIRGKIILYNSFYEGEEEKKMVIFEKNEKDNEFMKTIIGLKPKLDIEFVKNQLESKTIEELINNEDNIITIISKDKITIPIINKNDYSFFRNLYNLKKAKIRESMLSKIRNSKKKKEENLEDKKKINNSEQNKNFINEKINYSNSKEKEKEKKDLEEELKRAKKLIEEQKIKIKDLEDQLNNNKENKNIEKMTQSYQNQLRLKDKEIEELKIELDNIKKENNKGRLIHESEMVAIFFTSMDQKINFAIPCLKSSTFAEVEEKLYKEYPEYRETNNSFLANGNQILRFKTIEENKIGTGIPVILFVPNDGE